MGDAFWTVFGWWLVGDCFVASGSPDGSPDDVRVNLLVD